MTDPLDAVIAALRAYARVGQPGSVEIVFGAGGVPLHVHERRTTHLRERGDHAEQGPAR